MARKSLRKQVRLFTKWCRKYAPMIVVCIVVLGVYVGNMFKSNTQIDPTVFIPLLNLIAKGESNGNYNAYFGNSKNTQVDFTSMPISEVMAWQDTYVKQGSPSSAVGRYQIINKTLAGLIEQLGIPTSKKFDKPTQDMLAIALLERRGAVQYLNNKMTSEQFAANLAKEWASLPKVVGNNPQESYYAGDGLNGSRIGVDEVLSVIKQTTTKNPQ